MQTSAGILCYRVQNGIVEILLGHPGGPFWESKDSWGIPKGEVEPEENIFQAALREFHEETNIDLFTISSDPKFARLGSFKGSRKKNIEVWFIEQDLDISGFTGGNEIEIHWPRGTDNTVRFPEIDKLEWMTIEDAKKKIFKSQVEIIETFEKKVTDENLSVNS